MLVSSTRVFLILLRCPTRGCMSSYRAGGRSVCQSDGRRPFFSPSGPPSAPRPARGPCLGELAGWHPPRLSSHLVAKPESSAEYKSTLSNCLEVGRPVHTRAHYKPPIVRWDQPTMRHTFTSFRPRDKRKVEPLLLLFIEKCLRKNQKRAGRPTKNGDVWSHH
jgi:hypothetical protein